MEENPVSLRGTGIKYGLITAAICIVYFLIMRFAGLIHITALRFLNYAILAIGIYLALNEVKHKINKHRVNYLPGLALGFMIIFISAVLFSIFIFIYARFIDPNFIAIIKPELPSYYGELNGYIIGVFIFSETIMFGVILNFLVMQFYKRNRSPELEAKEEEDEKKAIPNTYNKP
jgi:hypothetical protein